jgi:predicted MFS family arabinose efflux permease
MSSAPPAGSARTVVVAGMSSVIGAIPSFLVGSLAVFLREDLVFDQAQLGLAIAIFFLASAVAAIPGGQVTERIGARLAMLIASAASGAAMLGIAVLARSWLSLVLWLALAGIANGVAQPAGNLALARGVVRARQGLAFGVKQSAIPGATLFAGGAVPLVGLTVGWRWAFVAAASGVLVLAILMPRDPYRSPTVRARGRASRPDMPVAGLALLAFAAACGAAVGTSLGSFYVEGAVSAGFSVGFSGVMLAVGSTACIASRLLIGFLADRWVRGHEVIMITILLLGALALVGLAGTAQNPGLLVPATLLAFVAAWGWPGIFNFTVARLNPRAPAAATAITQTGIFVGGVLGPAAFGAIAERASFTAAWLTAAVSCASAAITILLSRRLFAAGQASLTERRRTGVPGEGAEPTTGAVAVAGSMSERANEHETTDRGERRSWEQDG